MYNKIFNRTLTPVYRVIMFKKKMYQMDLTYLFSYLYFDTEMNIYYKNLRKSKTNKQKKQTKKENHKHPKYKQQILHLKLFTFWQE